VPMLKGTAPPELCICYDKVALPGRAQPSLHIVDQYVTNDPTNATLLPQIASGFQKCISCGDGTFVVPSIMSGRPYFEYARSKVLPSLFTRR